MVRCDSNARHSAWGSTNCNRRGEALLEFLNSTYLEILNRGNEPNFCSGGRFEVTDITIGSLKTPRKHFRLGGFTRAVPVRSQTYFVHLKGLRTGVPN